MFSIKKLFSKTNQCYVLKNEYQHVLFDFPAELYGTNHRLIRFGDTQKELKFVIPDIQYEDIDSIFVSKSDSLGIFFLGNDCPTVYLTEPVYEQLILKIDEFKKYQVYYDEEIIDPGKRVVGISQIGNFKPQLIKFNQIVDFSVFRIKSITAGTFIGWCNYLIEFHSELTNPTTILYIGSISFNQRFSLQPPELNPKYVILNNKICNIFKEETTENGIYAFTSYLEQSIKEKNIILIPVDMVTIFLEIIFHLFYLLHKNGTIIPIAIVSPVFNRLSTIVNIQSEWLNKTFQETVYSGNEPFSFKSYPNLIIWDGFEDLKGPAIIICSTLEYELMGPQIGFTVFNILDQPRNFEICNKTGHAFYLEVQADLKNIQEKFKNSEFIGFEDSTSKNYKIKLDNSISKIKLCNTELISIIKNEEILTFYFDGKVINTEENIFFNAEGNYLKTMFKSRWVWHDGWYEFINLKVKLKFENEKIIIKNIK